MRRGDYRTGRVVTCLIAGIVCAIGVAVLTPQIAEAQFALNLWACKKIEPRSQDFAFDLRISQCGNRFTTSDAYVGVVVHLQNVQERTEVVVELLDPEQSTVWTRRRTIESPDPGYFYPNIWAWGVLPITADMSALASENLVLTRGVIRIEGKPARERLGDWTIRARIDRGAPHTMRFSLQSAQ